MRASSGALCGIMRPYASVNSQHTTTLVRIGPAALTHPLIFTGGLETTMKSICYGLPPNAFLSH